MKTRTLLQTAFGTMAAAMIFSVSAQTSTPAPDPQVGAAPPPTTQSSGDRMDRAHKHDKDAKKETPRTSGSAGGENATGMQHTPTDKPTTTPQPGEPGHTTQNKGAEKAQ